MLRSMRQWWSSRLRAALRYHLYPKLLIKTNDGKVYKGRYPYHFDMMLDLNLDPETIVDTGWIVQRKKVWREDTSPEIRAYLKSS